MSCFYIINLKTLHYSRATSGLVVHTGQERMDYSSPRSPGYQHLDGRPQTATTGASSCLIVKIQSLRLLCSWDSQGTVSHSVAASLRRVPRPFLRRLSFTQPHTSHFPRTGHVYNPPLRFHTSIVSATCAPKVRRVLSVSLGSPKGSEGLWWWWVIRWSSKANTIKKLLEWEKRKTF